MAQVWEDRLVVRAVGGAHITSTRRYAQSADLHDPSDPLVIDHLPATTQLFGDAPIPVTRQLILNGTDHLNQALIPQHLPCGAGR